MMEILSGTMPYQVRIGSQSQDKYGEFEAQRCWRAYQKKSDYRTQKRKTQVLDHRTSDTDVVIPKDQVEVIHNREVTNPD